MTFVFSDQELFVLMNGVKTAQNIISLYQHAFYHRCKFDILRNRQGQNNESNSYQRSWTHFQNIQTLNRQ